MSDTIEYYTPDMLADALESGKYKIRTGSFGGTATNCCLGVAEREVGKQRQKERVTSFVTAGTELARRAPWLGQSVVSTLLAKVNDGSPHYAGHGLPKSKRWEQVTVPALRGLKLKKDGTLTAQSMRKLVAACKA